MINYSEKSDSLSTIDGMANIIEKATKIDCEQIDSSEEELAAVHNKVHQKTIQSTNHENRPTSSSDELADENSSVENNFEEEKGLRNFL
jgi:hypothetical protein